MRLRSFWPWPLALIALLLVACGQSEPAPSPTASPATPTPTSEPDLAGLPSTSLLPTFLDLAIPPPDTDASPPSVTPDRPGGSFGFTHYVFEKVGDDVVTTLVEGPRDKRVRLPLSYTQLKEMHESEGPSDQLPMTRPELATLVEQLDTVRQATEKYQDVSVALADGFVQATEEVANMGAHFVHPWRTLDGIFDPARPEILLYVSDPAGELRLVGTSFVLPVPLVGPDHPEAFAGPLDNWHVHYELCTGPKQNSRSSSAEECRADGGVWVPSYGWMIHAWVWDDNPLGAFNMWNPSVPPIANAVDIRESRSLDDALTVLIESFSFETTHVKVGDTLAWTNVDGVPHTVTAGVRGAPTGAFDSGTIVPGQSFAVTFDQPGEYRYTCTIHPFMTGTVSVSP